MYGLNLNQGITASRSYNPFGGSSFGSSFGSSPYGSPYGGNQVKSSFFGALPGYNDPFAQSHNPFSGGFNTYSYLDSMGTSNGGGSAVGYGQAFSGIGSSLYEADHLLKFTDNYINQGHSQTDVLAQQGMQRAMQWAQVRDDLRRQGYSPVEINQMINNMKGVPTNNQASGQSGGTFTGEFTDDAFWNNVLSRGQKSQQSTGGGATAGNDGMAMLTQLMGALSGSVGQGGTQGGNAESVDLIGALTALLEE